MTKWLLKLAQNVMTCQKIEIELVISDITAFIMYKFTISLGYIKTPRSELAVARMVQQR